MQIYHFRFSCFVFKKEMLWKQKTGFSIPGNLKVSKKGEGRCHRLFCTLQFKTFTPIHISWFVFVPALFFAMLFYLGSLIYIYIYIKCYGLCHIPAFFKSGELNQWILKLHFRLFLSTHKLWWVGAACLVESNIILSIQIYKLTKTESEKI
jgi:hypothetical protein